MRGWRSGRFSGSFRVFDRPSREGDGNVDFGNDRARTIEKVGPADARMR